MRYVIMVMASLCIFWEEGGISEMVKGGYKAWKWSVPQVGYQNRGGDSHVSRKLNLHH
jgi:hypothetical protein